MSIKSSQGFTIGYGQEASLGAGAAAYVTFRPEEQLDWPTATKKLVENANAGHAHPAARNDKGVPIAITGEGALSLRVRRHNSDNTQPMIATLFESMGCHIKTTTKTTVAGYVSTEAWDLTGDGAAYGDCGDVIMPKLESAGNALDEYYYPTLIAKKATNTITPAMALPCATANAEPIEVMTTIYPLSRPMPTGKSLAFEMHTRGDSVGDGTEFLGFLYKAGAVGSVGEIVLTPNEPIKIPFNLLFGNVERQSLTIAAETYALSETFAIVTDQFRIELGDWLAAGGVNRNDLILREAKIDLGITAVPIIGEGSGCVNGRSGYILTFGQPKVTITMAYLGEVTPTDFWTLFEGSNTSKHLGLVQPTSALTTPAWAFYLPNCHMPDGGLKLKKDREVLDVEVTLIGDCARFVSTSNDGLWDDEGFAPWYMAISGEGA
jgi:hypothetical protein